MITSWTFSHILPDHEVPHPYVVIRKVAFLGGTASAASHRLRGLCPLGRQLQPGVGRVERCRPIAPHGESPKGLRFFSALKELGSTA